MAVSDGTENSNTAFSVLTVEHGCPCSSFTNDTIVTPGLVSSFEPTEGVTFPGTEWGWGNASCQVEENSSTDFLIMDFNLLVGVEVAREWVFVTNATNCLSTVKVGISQGSWFERKGEGTPIFRPSEEIADYTPEMNMACRTRIPIQIERLRATFHADGASGNASNCAPPP